MKVTVYGRPDCCLCDEAKAVLMRVRSAHPFEFEEIDVTSDLQLELEFGDRVPLIKIDDRLAFKYQVDEKELLRDWAALDD